MPTFLIEVEAGHRYAILLHTGPASGPPIELLLCPYRDSALLPGESGLDAHLGVRRAQVLPAHVGRRVSRHRVQVPVGRHCRRQGGLRGGIHGISFFVFLVAPRFSLRLGGN